MCEASSHWERRHLGGCPSTMCRHRTTVLIWNRRQPSCNHLSWTLYSREINKTSFCCHAAGFRHNCEIRNRTRAFQRRYMRVFTPSSFFMGLWYLTTSTSFEGWSLTISFVLLVIRIIDQNSFLEYFGFSPNFWSAEETECVSCRELTSQQPFLFLLFSYFTFVDRWD